MCFLVSPAPVMAQNGEETEEEEEVLVPIEMMRNALWYRESYYIQEDLLESREQTIQDLEELSRDLEQDNARLSESQKVWRTAFFVTLGLSVGQWALWRLTQ